MFDLSIVIPTCNRANLLERSLLSLVDTVRCRFEVVVVDGASTDHTPDVLARAADLLGDRLKVIAEPERQGFVRAANRGFRSATGRHMTWLNDDARPCPGALDAAVLAMEVAPPDLAFLALYHRWHSPMNVAYEATRDGEAYQVCHVRGTLYANFCVGRRATYERLGLFDERYYFFAADPDLSLKAWHAGLRVEPLDGAFVEHDEHADDRRAADAARGRRDNERLFAKWDLPPRNPTRNDFDSARPCTLRGLRAGQSAAA
jgi:rhamnopyranosyl-N-acetylglucosaminyl-diphospho-decaprenol beta-1,3/1,4-galactofuranosyltransferase